MTSKSSKLFNVEERGVILTLDDFTVCSFILLKHQGVFDHYCHNCPCCWPYVCIVGCWQQFSSIGTDSKLVWTLREERKDQNVIHTIQRAKKESNQREKGKTMNPNQDDNKGTQIKDVSSGVDCHFTGHYSSWSFIGRLKSDYCLCTIFNRLQTIHSSSFNHLCS